MKERSAYLILAAVLATGVLLAALFYSGPFYSFDDFNYITYAHQILNQSFSVQESPYAYGFFVPMSIALSFGVLGYSVFASVYPEVIEYLALILLAFLVGRSFGNRHGLMAAFLVATAPFVVGYSTRVLPDMGAGVCAALAVLAFMHAEDSGHEKVLYFISGAAAALTIFFKMIGLAFMLFFVMGIAVYSLRRRKLRRTGVAYPVVGMLAFGIAYIMILGSQSGNFAGPFLLYGQNQVNISPTNLTMNVDTAGMMLFGYSSPYYPLGPSADAQVFPFGLIIFLAMAGTAIGAAERNRLMNMFSVIVWGVFLYLFFGTVTLNGYNLITVVSRYFVLVAIPMAMLAVFAITAAGKRLAKKFGKPAASYIEMLLLALVVLSCVPAYLTVYSYNSVISGNTASLQRADSYLLTASRGQQATLLASGQNTAGYMAFLSGYGNHIRTVALNSTFAGASGQVFQLCQQSGSEDYFLLVYDNYSRGTEESIFKAWVEPYCNLTEVTSFGNASAPSVYNGLSIEADLYRFG